MEEIQEKMSEDKLNFIKTTTTKKIDSKGNVVAEGSKTIEGSIDLKNIKDSKIGIDSNMLTSAILSPDFKKILIENMGEDSPHTTHKCRMETIGNIKYKLKITYPQAKIKFDILQKEIKLRFLNLENNDFTNGKNLFNKIKSSGIKIKKIKTFLADCVNVTILLRNGITTFFCNDEDLAKGCKNQKISMEFISLATSNEKIIKNFYKEQTKFRRRKKGQKARK
tara:strand:- start:1787 stop:2455 length:669 start_codon:yes stop_codon:yes gene_type:complete